MRYAFALLISAVVLLSNTYAITHTPEELEIMRKASYHGPRLINASHQQQELIEYARSISKDFDFILTILAESGFRPDAIGDQGRAKGLCQWRKDLGRGRLVDDPKFPDGKFQIDSCYHSYIIWRNNGKLQSRLYGYNVRKQYTDRFTLGL